MCANVREQAELVRTVLTAVTERQAVLDEAEGDNEDEDKLAAELYSYVYKPIHFSSHRHGCISAHANDSSRN